VADPKVEGEAEDTSESSATTNGSKRRKLQRKPLWLLIPVSVSDEDGKELAQYRDCYRLVKCSTKAEIKQRLANLHRDETTENARLVRGDELSFSVSVERQVTIKW